MRATQHSSNTRVLGAPAGWKQGVLPVGALPITDSKQNGIHTVVSFYAPTAEDLAILNARGLIAVSVVGVTMPPIAVYTEDTK